MAEEATTTQPAGTDQTTDTTTQATEPAADVTWRESIKDEEVRKHSERFDSIDSLARGNLELRKKLSGAITLPGKDASEEDIASFRKAIGVPQTADEYELEGIEINDDTPDYVKDNLAKWKSTFHENNITPKAVGELQKVMVEIAEAEKARQVEADKTFASESEAALKAEWPGDEYQKNMTIANRAAEKLFGDDFEGMRSLETKSGKLVLDHPALARVFAKIGREMDEGSLGPVPEGERESVKSQIETVRAKKEEAMQKGNMQTVRSLDEQERKLWAKLDGDDPI